MSPANIQPAIKSYFFEKGYKDLGNTIKDSWKLNLDTAARFMKKFTGYWAIASEEKYYYFLVAGAGFAALSVVVFGTLFFLALSAVHIAILGFFFLVIYLSFTFIWAIDKLYRVKNKIFTACPACHNKSDLPAYLCSRCGTAHTQLIPNSYGILKRTCLCGQKLPTSFLNGRTQLQAKCPRCGYGIETKETVPVCIPVIGGPSVGKTCYLFAAARALIEDIAPQNAWETPFLDSQNEELFQCISLDFNHGIVPAKTTELNPRAFNFFIKSNQWTPAKILYFYDAAGEAFKESKELLSHRFYGYLHGFLFIIDPFSIPDLVDQYENSLKQKVEEIRPSAMMLEDAFDIMLINLEKNHRVRLDRQITQPCAVVIDKIDAFDLEERIGHKAVKKYIDTHPGLENFKEAEDGLLKEFLKELGMGNFLRKLEHKFQYYHFFTCSALGRNPGSNRQKFEPRRVVEPLLWLLGQANKDLKITNQEVCYAGFMGRNKG